MSEIIKNSYYAVIPATVRYDKSLSASAKLLYGEITALANEKGYCWAKNKHFANLYNVEKATISRWVSRLKNNGYVRIHIIYEENSREVKERRIYIVDTPGRNEQYPQGEMSNTPRAKQALIPGRNEQYPQDEMSKDINTDINTGNNTFEKRKILFSSLIKKINSERNEPLDNELLQRFIDHWTSKNRNGKKFAFEKEKTFDHNKRMTTFLSNDKAWHPEKYNTANFESKKTQAPKTIKL